MQKTIAKLISGIFNPLIMPTLGILILFTSNSYFALLPFEAKKVIFLTIIISTFLLPLSFLPLFFYQNLVSSMSLKTKKERIIPFSVIFFIYILAYFLMRKMGSPAIINNMILGGSIAIFLLTLLTLHWKISAHMAGIGSLTGVLLIFSFQLKANLLIFIILAFIVAGLVGTSRIILKSHNPGEVYVGFFLGLISLVSTYLIFH